MNHKISACLIVKNEESCIEQCLKNARNYVDEILMVDTGSTDNTVNLARKYADRILHFKWNDDFSSARNFSIQSAQNDWIIVLDADETVKQWDEKNINHFINKMIQTVDKTVFKQKGLEMVFLWRINSGEANQQKSDKKG